MMEEMMNEGKSVKGKANKPKSLKLILMICMDNAKKGKPLDEGLGDEDIHAGKMPMKKVKRKSSEEEEEEDTEEME